MLELFKKDNFDRKMPVEYKHLLDQQAYETMLNTILQYFDEKGEPVLQVESGYIVTKGEGGEGVEHQYGLDNLTKIVAAAPVDDRESVIYTHFNKAFYDMRPLEYFKTDYEAAKQYLKILIKHEGILAEKGAKDVVHKTVFPGTVSVLVFDYDNKFVYLYNETIKEWGKTVDELFEEALFNISNEEVQILSVNFTQRGEDEADENNIEEEGNTDPKAFIFMNGDFAAPVMLAPTQMAPFIVGEYGAIITIPSKGAAIAAPVYNAEIFDYLNVIAKLTRQYFDDNPGNITTSLYWYYNGQHEAFPERLAEEKEGFVSVSVPEQLIQLLNGE